MEEVITVLNDIKHAIQLIAFLIAFYVGWSLYK